MSKIANIVSILTLPGALERFSCEHRSCRAAKIAVLSGDPFTLDDFSHVRHEAPVTVRSAYNVASSSFTTNLMLGTVVSLVSLCLVFILHNTAIWAWLLMWLGFSLLCNTFPSKPDVITLRYLLSRSDEKYGFISLMSKIYAFGSKLEQTGLIVLTTLLYECVLAGLLMLIFTLVF